MSKKQEEKKKYLIIPGHVYSQADGDSHFISATQLINLYGVDPRECIIAEQKITENSNHPEKWYPEDLIALRPRYDGKYRETYEEIKNKEIPNQ